MLVRFSRLLLAIIAISSLSACVSTVDVRGNKPLPEFLSEIKPGQQVTKSDVVALIGTPSTTSPFSDDHWYYISSTFESRAFFDPVELERQIVAIDFDADGKVIAVRNLTLADGQEVAMIPRETPAPGKELSLWAQLLGNIGHYNESLKKDKDKDKE